MALLEVSGLTKYFEKDGRRLAALNGISFSINEGESMALVGESGCGKSTAAAIITRLIKQDGGKVVFAKEDITSRKRLRPAGRDIQMIFQSPQDSFDPRDTVLEGIMQGAASYGLYSKAELREKALKLLSYVGLKEEYAFVKTYELSGGECQRAAIARSLICSPRLLICDEATSALDVLIQAQIIDLLKRLKFEKNMSLLFITHDLSLAAALCERTAVMHEGQIVEEGETKQILKDPHNIHTKMLIESAMAVWGEKND